MKLHTIAFACLLLAANVTVADNDDAIGFAEAAAGSWLKLADQSEFEDTWLQASSLFQGAISQMDWQRALGAARTPLKELVSRNRVSAEFYETLPGAPDGEYVVLTFNSSFTKKSAAVETVTVMKDEDGSWRVSGYFIK